MTNYSECVGYNIYGRIMNKRKKGSSYFYSLLNTHAKNDGWVSCSLKMESEALDEGMNWDCNEYDTLTRVKQVYKTPYFNRLKQFYLRLIRNNIFINKNTRNNITQSCFFVLSILRRESQSCLHVKLLGK